ncbi:MAG TPA: gamma-glutamylcyclotransferase [Leptolyngbyaceae cyanobacterium]
MNKLKIFVYGTLKPGEANYKRFCAGSVVEAKRAIAFGQLFNLPLGYPAMRPGESPVQGFLLTFTDPKVLSILDELEDYDPHRTPEDNEYDRQQVEIYDLGRQSLGLAWVYLMTSEQVQHLGGVLMRSGWWSGSIDTLRTLPKINHPNQQY